MSLVEVIIRDERRRVWTLVVPLTGADRSPQNATLGLERSERQSRDPPAVVETTGRGRSVCRTATLREATRKLSRLHDPRKVWENR